MEKQAPVYYTIYDGRFRTDPDRASVLCTADTLEKARLDVQMFNDGPIDFSPVIVEAIETEDETIDGEIVE